MKASQINPSKDATIQTRTDARRCLTTQWALDQWIAEYGDCDVVYTTNAQYPQYGHYAVPSLKDAIDEYSAAKQIDCDRYGCE
jgi:hypothetical protein